MIRISNKETAILGLIAEESRYGYDIEKIIQDRGMRNWTEIGFSSIYYVLNKLEKKELVESKIENNEGRPSRRVYFITDKGKKEMKNKVKELLSNNTKLITPFDLGVSNIPLIEKKEVLGCLEDYKKSVEVRINFLSNSLEKLKVSGTPLHVIALFERPLQHLLAEKKWLEDLVTNYKSNEEYD